MAKRSPPEEHANHEAWAIPYADLMTLLLAFFVVMYAISSVNDGKYQHMAQALNLAFGGSARSVNPMATSTGITPLQLNANAHSAIVAIKQPVARDTQPEHLNKPSKTSSDPPQLAHINQRLERALAPLLHKGVISIWRNERWIEVEINSDILFATGSAVLDEDARSILGRLATVLRDEPNKIRVEGHTDNVPIATALYPSNWELSAARAASVVHLFADRGLPPQRLAMIGYGEFHPRADNADTQGRNRNRRVAVIVLADATADVAMADSSDLPPHAQTMTTSSTVNPVSSSTETAKTSSISVIREGNS